MFFSVALCINKLTLLNLQALCLTANTYNLNAISVLPAISECVCVTESLGRARAACSIFSIMLLRELVCGA